MFPEIFYKNIHQIKLQKTSTPTGLLDNPLDLVNSPTPWLMIKPSVTEISAEKKVLIFADHFWNLRWRDERSTMMQLLDSAMKAGFTIICVSPDGTTYTKKHKEDIAFDYALSPHTFNYDAIHALIYQKYGLTSINSVVLGGIETTRILNSNQLDLSIFLKSPSIAKNLANLVNLLPQKPAHHWEIRCDERVLSIFFAEYFDYAVKLFTTASGISFDDRISANNIIEVLRLSTNIRYLKIYPLEIGHLSLDLPSDHFKKLKEVIFLGGSSELTPTLVDKIFFASPVLENIQILTQVKTKSDAFQNIIASDLCKQYKSITIDDIRGYEDVTKLLSACSNLTALTINGYSRFYRDLPNNSLPHLETLSIQNRHYHSSDDVTLAEVFNVSPNLRQILALECGGKSATVIHDNFALPYLTHIKAHINSDTELQLLSNATCLQFMDIRFLSNGYFNSYPPMMWPELKKLNITGPSNVPLNQLISRSSHLEELCIEITLGYGSPKKYEDAITLTPNSLLSLKKFTIKDKSSSREIIYSLMHAAPNIDSLTFEVHSIDLSKINLNQFSQLTFLDMECTAVSSGDINFILVNGKNLKELKIRNAGALKANNVFDLDDIKESINLEKLEIITLIEIPITPKGIKYLLDSAPTLVRIKIVSPHLSNKINGLPIEVIRTLSLKQLRTGDIEEVNHTNRSATQRSALNQGSNLDRTKGGTDLDLANENIDKPLYYTEYFPGVYPAKYRLMSSDPDMDSLLPLEESLSSSKFEKIIIPSKTTLAKSDFNFKSGKIVVKNKKTVVLPSLDPEEKLLNEIQIINDKNEFITINRCEIKFCKNTRFYQITLPLKGAYTILFELALPKIKAVLPADLQSYSDKYNEFKPTSSRAMAFYNYHDISTYIRENKTGSCLYRSIAAYEEMKDNYQVHIILNDVHAFIEVNLGNHFYQLDLGGYPAKLVKNAPETIVDKLTETIAADNKIEVINEDVKINPQADTAKPKIKITPFIQVFTHKMFLLQLEKDTDFVVVLDKLIQDKTDSTEILILNRPEEINLSAAGMTHEGKIKSNYTKLNIWLNGRDQGTLLIDIREFDIGEIAQLNDLLDRRIENQVIADNIQIILLDNINRSHYGPDFRRRIPLSCKVPSSSRDFFQEASIAALANTLEIDLYNSPYWKTNLIGSWTLTTNPHSTDLSFAWKKGQLLNIFSNPIQSFKNIIFKNPPLSDRSFFDFITELHSLKRLQWADQVTLIPDDIHFYQSQGYDWKALGESASLANITQNIPAPYVLSDSNILSFTQPVTYVFTETTNEIEPRPSYFQVCKQAATMDVICDPNLSPGTLASFLVAAKEQNIRIRFLTRNTQELPYNSALKHLDLPVAPKPGQLFAAQNVHWILHEDVDFAIQHYLSENKETYSYDLSSLDMAELSRYPLASIAVKNNFLKQGKFSLNAPLSDILIQLKNNKTVLLSGKIPSLLTTPLTSLTLGIIEGKPFSGKLIIITPPSEAPLAQALMGEKLKAVTAVVNDKISLAFKVNHCKTGFLSENSLRYSEIEKEMLQATLPIVSVLSNDDPLLSDADRAQLFDQQRLHSIKSALAINPWVMIEGSTGVGKSSFFKNVLAADETVFDLSQWLTTPALPGKDLILLIDEANFNTELNGAGSHFIERFKSLKQPSPGFLWKGTYYSLSKHHKVIFAFNPASYGAGRTAEGLLNDSKLSVIFTRLPDFYLRTRIIKPIVDNNILFDEKTIQHVFAPVIDVYNWILMKSVQKSLITPREIRAMVNLIVTRIVNDKISDPTILLRLAQEIAYIIGKQTLGNHPSLAAEFEVFKPAQSLLTRKIPTVSIASYQNYEYQLIEIFFSARSAMLSKENHDIGLGGILLEGDSGIGKTYFINQMVVEYQNKYKQKAIRISPSTPFHEKEKLLREAFENGSMVVAEEYNSSIWPNKLLNSYLMGKDEQGKPADNPGFILLATQNPPSFGGRHEEDPAMRRRLIKLELGHWPVYEKTLTISDNLQTIENPNPASELAVNDVSSSDSAETKKSIPITVNSSIIDVNDSDSKGKTDPLDHDNATLFNIADEQNELAQQSLNDIYQELHRYIAYLSKSMDRDISKQRPTNSLFNRATNFEELDELNSINSDHSFLALSMFTDEAIQKFKLADRNNTSSIQKGINKLITLQNLCAAGAKSQTALENLKTFKAAFDNNRATLDSYRDSKLKMLLRVIATILMSVTIILLPITPRLWKNRGQQLTKKIDDIQTNKRNNKKRF